MNTAELLSQASKLEPTERAMFAQQLLRSLGPEVQDVDTERQWPAELRARSDAFRAGTIKAGDWRDAVNRVGSALPRPDSVK